MTDEQANTLLGLGQKLVGALPAQFLALLLVNIVVIGGMVWHLDNVSAQRERVLAQLITGCVQHAP
jgi:hypothetical protein